ncbi:hypothetical protein U9M48_017690 [Paspalum notatum var. saurae]|uniref:Uncharacterized protein n=1 Tax=Paspalum notatum var. saurae TaxID=547442 RepID=A0AAQ3T8C4_PASNO
MLGLTLADIIPVVPRLHIPKFPDDEGIPDLGELDRREPGVLNEACPELALRPPPVPVRPELALLDDGYLGVQVLYVDIEGKALALLGHSPGPGGGVGGSEAEGEIEDEGAVEVVGLGDGAQEAAQVVRHGFAAVAAAEVDEVGALGELGTGKRGRWRRGDGSVGGAAAGLAGVGARVVIADGDDGVGACVGVAGDCEAAVVLGGGLGGGVGVGAGAPGHVAGGGWGVTGDGASEAGEVDGREGLDGAAHHEVEQARVGAVERGGGVAGLLLRLLVGEGGGGAWGGGKGDAEERDEEDEDEDEEERGCCVGGRGEEGAAPKQRADWVHRVTRATATRAAAAATRLCFLCEGKGPTATPSCSNAAAGGRCPPPSCVGTWSWSSSTACNPGLTNGGITSAADVDPHRQVVLSSPPPLPPLFCSAYSSSPAPLKPHRRSSVFLPNPKLHRDGLHPYRRSVSGFRPKKSMYWPNWPSVLLACNSAKSQVSCAK